MRPSPPPPPSARRMDLQYADPQQQQYTDPQQYPDPTAHGMPYYADHAAIDPTAETVEAGALDGEPNPFKKPSRWRRWVKRPSREFMVRGGVAVLAAALGWGVGAKPWKAQPATVAAANKAGAAHPAVKAQPVRRVAVSSPASAPAAKSRTATAPAATTQKKTTAATPSKTQATTKTQAVTKTAAKPVAKSSTTKPTAKVASKPKTSVSTAK